MGFSVTIAMVLALVALAFGFTLWMLTAVTGVFVVTATGAGAVFEASAADLGSTSLRFGAVCLA